MYYGNSSNGAGAPPSPAPQPQIRVQNTRWMSDDMSIYLAGGRMASMAHARAAHPVIRELAGRIGSGCTTRRCTADAIWTWVHQNITLRDHNDLACAITGHCSGDVQFLVDPLLVLELGEGDCAIQTPLACSLLEASGVPCRMVPVAADPSDPSRFTHVFSAAVLEDGSLYPLDTSHGPAPGWETPTEFRRAVWPVFGGVM